LEMLLVVADPRFDNGSASLLCIEAEPTQSGHKSNEQASHKFFVGEVVSNP